MELRIAVLPGDGIGPEVTTEAVKVLEAVGRRHNLSFRFTWADVGGIAMDKHGTPLPQETLALARKSQASLFGAVGGPKWDDPRAKARPEQGILGLRKGLGLFANLRPISIYPDLAHASPVKPHVLDKVDMVIVRELTGGLYYARPKKRWSTPSGRRGVDTLRYTEKEISRILKVGFELAQARRQKLTSVDKANVLETSRLWREMATEMGRSYPQVQLEHMLVDSCAMQLVKNPSRFDVIVTENTFGDILTDEASVLSASLGMLPSASLASVPDSARKTPARGLYEPIHGSAPDIAGQGKANPVGAILSGALLLRYSFGLFEAATTVEKAVEAALVQGYRTADIATPGEKTFSTAQVGDAVADLVQRL